MKKLVLLLAAGSLALSSGAQERNASVVFEGKKLITNKERVVTTHKQMDGSVHSSNKTTSGEGLWYSYADTVLPLAASITATDFSTMFLWQDTAALFGTGSTTTPFIGYSVPSYGFNYNTSVGLGFNPMTSTWPSGYTISQTTSYIIDSVKVVGVYGRPNSASYTDHLNLSFVYGNMTSTSNIGLNGFLSSPDLVANYGISSTDTLFFPDVFWDTTTNQATNRTGGPAPVTYSFPLTATDTSVTFLHAYTYPVNFSVPAGNISAMSVSFVSGATSFPTFPATDTVIYADGSTYKYGEFEPITIFASDGSGNASFAPYRAVGTHFNILNDYTTGYLKTEGSTDADSKAYYPHWGLSASDGSAWYEQYPYIMFHIKGTGVGTPNTIKAASEVNVTPNPASDMVSVVFNLSSVANVTVTLTNMVGQVVGTQNIDNTAAGKATFNTSTLPAGVYVYTLIANGERSTGRVVVAH